MRKTADVADATEWLRFLQGAWPDDPAAIELLQEWFGYVISGRTDLQKILLLVGPPRSGKGTISRVLRQLVGEQHTAAPTLTSLTRPFGQESLIGKPLAIVADARLSGPTGGAVEMLLSMSGEDPQDIDRKNRAHWLGRLPCRFMLCSNELPRFTDASAAIASRFLPLIMRRGHLGAEDLGLADRLETELPAILHWALDGLARLTETGRFTESADFGGVLDELRELSSPVSAFVRERCELGGGEIEMAELYRHWRQFAEDNGLTPGSAQTFGRNLVAAFPEIQRSRPGTQRRQRVYRGIGLR